MSLNAPAGAYGGRRGLPGTPNPNQAFGYVFGAAYVLIGLVGFIVTTHLAFAATQGKPLIIFNLNPLHNVVHIALGILFLAGALAGETWAARVNTLIGAGYLLVGIAGLFVIGGSLNYLALNQADNGLHFVTAVLALGVGLYGLTRGKTASVTA
jgi:hypothetical protein